MTAVAVTNTFIAGNVIKAAEFNTNFSDLVTYINNRNDGSATWDALRVTTASAVVAIFNNSSGTTDILRAQDNGTSVFVVADGGNVGLGATTPDARLELEGAAADIHQDGSGAVYHYVDRGATTNEGLVVFQTAGVTKTAIGMDNDSTDSIHLFSGGDLGTPKVSLDASGNFVFNDTGADADFRIEGDTVSNLFFTDASTDRIGIGTVTPDQKLTLVGSSIDIHQDSSSAVYHYIDRGANTNEAMVVFQTAGVTKTAIGMDNDSTDNIHIFVNGSLGTPVVSFFSTGGVNIGQPTGGDKGAATLNITNDIYKNNVAYTSPDYVLEHWANGKIEKFINNDGAKDYKGLRSLEEIENISKETLCLPFLGEARQRMKDIGGVGIFAGGDALLASVEEAYIHLFQINKRLKNLEAK